MLITLRVLSQATNLGDLYLLTGVDLSDQRQVEALTAEFNALPEEERARLLQIDQVPMLEQSYMLSGNDLDERAKNSDLVKRLEAIAHFFADPRKLTQTGKVTRSDCRELVTLLDTKDSLEYGPDGCYKFQTIDDLPQLAKLFSFAMVARVLRRQDGKAVSNKSWLKRSSLKPFETYQECLSKILRFYLLPVYWDQSLREAATEIVNLNSLRLLRTIVELGSIETDDLHSLLCARMLLPYDTMTEDYFQSPSFDGFLRTELINLVNAWELLDIVEWRNATELSSLGFRRRTGGVLETTVIGAVALNKILHSSG